MIFSYLSLKREHILNVFCLFRLYNKQPSQTQNEQKLIRVRLTTLLPSQDQNIICTLLKTKYI